MLQPIIQTYPEEALAGGLARRITVPASATALVQRDGQIETLPPGQHPVRSLWAGLIGRPAPPIWLVQTGPITLHPVFANLLDADDQLIFMDMLVAARITDPVRFWRALNPGHESLTKSDLERLLAETLAGRIRTLVKKYPLQSLIHLPEAQDVVQKGVIQSLRAVLQEWGMELRGVTHLGFQKADDAVTIERQARAIRRALDDMALQDEVERMEDQAILEHARAEFGLTDADIAELQAQLAQEKQDREAFQALLEEKLARMQQAMEERLEALAEEKQKPPKRAPSTIPEYKNLERMVVALRIAFYVIAAITAANAVFYRYLPFLNHYNDHFHLIGSVLGLLLALAALASAWLVDRRRVFQVEQARQEEQKRLSRAEQERKIARERAIRRYMQKRLRLIADNCQEIWKRIYQTDIDLATAIRKQCVQPYNALADSVLAADFTTARFFRENKTDPEQLAGLLDLTEKLRDNVEALVRASQQGYKAATDQDLTTLRTILHQLDQGRMALKNQFAEREQFLTS